MCLSQWFSFHNAKSLNVLVNCYMLFAHDWYWANTMHINTTQIAEFKQSIKANKSSLGKLHFISNQSIDDHEQKEKHFCSYGCENDSIIPHFWVIIFWESFFFFLPQSNYANVYIKCPFKVLILNELGCCGFFLGSQFRIALYKWECNQLESK